MKASASRRAEIQEARAPIALTEAYSIRSYVVAIPNRTALGAFQYEHSDTHLVSLPLVSILEARP